MSHPVSTVGVKLATACLACSISLGAAAQSASASAEPASAASASSPAVESRDKPSSKPRTASKSPKKHALDHSGKTQRGKASYYAKRFAGRKMADGTPMNPQADIAASKTLPLGTKAEVKNLENGKSEVVEIRDRGPYVDGRIVDLSPKVAEKLDIVEDGVAPVEVRPIEVPQPDGSVKLGDGARDNGASSSGR
ncbi:rare lipoprotein A [Noviherbaspirillum humi]|uniref:Endolytic peptidoglycan transglycosylase RlpA n=1 Tax=Noviherbaspirillum humi TaxID=1688639 RepID=A0A239FFK4_9BURK|nr:septal ring lytic transglycosylase RlpA family protein [Noviherbaspirillum humi]SNS55525.1 rare lipoprotein A [Noviherbaspirillum humi]